MAKVSNEAKRAWNAAHYTQVKVSVKPEIASTFKAMCLREGVSIASELSNLMSRSCNIKAPKKPTVDITSNRQRRRKALKKIIDELLEIKNAEECYQENIPENLQNSSVFDRAEQAVSALEEAINILTEAY